jgi:diguanylate cyclase (GGDEF)-like protein
MHVAASLALTTTLYANAGLFVLTLPLFDTRSTNWGYGCQALGLLGIWLRYHTPNSLVATLTLILLLGGLWGIRLSHLSPRQRLFVEALVTLLFGTIFWCLRPHWQGTVAAWLMFVIMTGATMSYWFFVQHRKLVASVALDPLTGAKNYGAFEQELQAAFGTAQQRQQPLTLVMLDIDYFKNINDTYGHLAGDQILTDFTAALQQQLATAGFQHVLYRTGGEEFNVILAGQSVTDSRPLIAEFWQKIRNTTFTYDDQPINFTISVGMTQLRPTDTQASALYKRADRYLYQSKHEGRDAITIEGTSHYSMRHNSLVATYAFFTQAVLDFEKDQSIRNELLMRVYYPERGKWLRPLDFNMAVSDQIALMRRTIAHSTIKSVALNLTPQQFRNEAVATELIQFNRQLRFQNQTDAGERLVLEITHAPDLATMQRMSQIYHAGHIKLTMDSVGTINAYEQVAPLLPYLDYLKFSVQRLDDAQRRTEGLTLIKFWKQVADAHHLMFIVEGVETDADLSTLKQIGVRYAQGYYFGEPVLPRMTCLHSGQLPQLEVVFY